MSSLQHSLDICAKCNNIFVPFWSQHIILYIYYSHDCVAGCIQLHLCYGTKLLYQLLCVCVGKMLILGCGQGDIKLINSGGGLRPEVMRLNCN